MKQGEFSRTKVAELMGDYFLLLGLVLELPCIFLKRKKKRFYLCRQESEIYNVPFLGRSIFVEFLLSVFF